MDEIVLTDKTNTPGEELLRSTLGKAYSSFIKLDELTADFSHEWKFYNKKSGWIYKIFDKKKSLCWITPLKEYYNMVLSLREQEREIVLKKNISKEINEKLVSSKKYPEGYALSLKIQKKDDYHHAEQLLLTLMELRKKK